jgi:hypothetical protein
MSSPNSTTDAPTLADLQQELAQQRREAAKNLQAQILKSINELQPKDGTPRTAARKQNNALARSKKFFVPLGAGAEEREDFEESWVTLLKSQTASQHVMLCISRLIVTIINDEGRDLRPTDGILCVATVSAAVDVGKGAQRRDLTWHLAGHLPHALLTAACVARPCTVKPTELQELSGDDDTDDDTDDDSPPESEDEGVSSKSAAKAKLKAKLEAEKAKRKRACIKRWQHEMTQAEKDAYVAAFMAPNQPIEQQARRQRAHTRTFDAAALGHHPTCTRLPRAALRRDAGAHDDAEGAHPVPLPDAQGQAA